ncbi:glycosyltransferase family 4 protein [Pannus brasiliensis CCIBt3594]|uniref:Glycosyltransferase family 4 protein n=1 Tax=Pannus brasiliensis CCIBt3594 TaxID=1427578 RepID=A0AAW9QZJ9_9CHRO
MSRKITILYIITRSDLGGAQAYVKDLIGGFHPKYNIHLATGLDGPLTQSVKSLGISTHIIPSLIRSINPFTDLRAVLDTMRLIRKIQPDLIHVNSTKAGITGRIAGKLCNVPTVFTAHGWSFSPNTPIARRLLGLFSEQLATFISTKIICVCDSDRRLALRYQVGNERILSCIPLGINKDSVPLAQPGIQPPRIIMVARFNEQKDQPTLLKAIAQLQDPDVPVDFVGGGISLDSCKTLARSLGIDRQVSFLGDRSDVPELLARAGIFVLSTHYEGLPISILEALRAGLPVVATKVNGIPEEVEDGRTGFLVANRDVDGLASALETLIRNPDLRQTMGEFGRQKFSREFTLDRMLSETEKIYLEILSRSP